MLYVYIDDLFPAHTCFICSILGVFIPFYMFNFFPLFFLFIINLYVYFFFWTRLQFSRFLYLSWSSYVFYKDFLPFFSLSNRSIKKRLIWLGSVEWSNTQIRPNDVIAKWTKNPSIASLNSVYLFTIIIHQTNPIHILNSPFFCARLFFFCVWFLLPFFFFFSLHFQKCMLVSLRPIVTHESQTYQTSSDFFSLHCALRCVYSPISLCVYILCVSVAFFSLSCVILRYL